MKSLARALLALALAFPALACAQATPESRAEAARMLDTMDMNATLQKSIDIALDAQLKAQPALEPYRGVMLDFFSKYMSYEALKPKLVEIYAEAFTATELAEIRSFYASPTGHKALDVMPTLMQKGGDIGREQIEAHLPELLKQVQDQTDRINAAKPAAKVSSTPAPAQPEPQTGSGKPA